MTNKPYYNLLISINDTKNCMSDAVRHFYSKYGHDYEDVPKLIKYLYDDGFFDNDADCLYNNYSNRFYNQVLKEDASGCIDADIYRHCMEAVQQNGMLLAYINNQKEDICFNAVKQTGTALEFVKNQTEKVCYAAIGQCASALHHVRKQTPELCITAVKKNGHALLFVREQTLELCLEAVKQNGSSIKYIKNQTEEICTEAVKQNRHAIMYIKYPSTEVQLLSKVVGTFI